MYQPQSCPDKIVELKLRTLMCQFARIVIKMKNLKKYEDFSCIDLFHRSEIRGIEKCINLCKAEEETNFKHGMKVHFFQLPLFLHCFFRE